ncbi:hypothetical protein H2200_000413 [Cladophialophora chaetospira]|uniref:F-box domain-containing protein n=1 Tax=Cladophialophora chaetospira TaxID=386627 RepID=A0AA38XPE6_9EURO|nr:hypothetical protein H2200_000413 [Cladophialophora chaetospira]
MEHLPEEILIDILDYLDPEELISIQRTCTRFSKLARANPLWRYKSFEKSPSATMRQANSILNTLTNALQGLTLSERPVQPQDSTPNGLGSERIAESARARAVNQWDLSAKGEKVDWYSEYKARYAPLSANWLPDDVTAHSEIKGISSLSGTDKVIGYLEDDSVRIWDLSPTSSGKRQFRELGRSNLQASIQFPKFSLRPSEHLVVDCVSTSVSQQRAYVAAGNAVKEIDLDTLKVVSHSSYPYPITALSQPGPLDLPLTVGTQWSLHVLDPRTQATRASQSSVERIDEIPARPSKLTAMLPDISGESSLLPTIFRLPSLFSTKPVSPAPLSSSPSWRASEDTNSLPWNSYAKVEPGPLSILHHADNEILICGRFPSILSYDRRYFPQLQYVVHSSASLSAMASLPCPPARSPPSLSGTSTLVACGEYRGRGSLELYSLPHVRPGQQRPSIHESTSSTPPDDGDIDLTGIHHLASDSSLFSYKNRQTASNSKLLFVAAHGTKIVYSDSEGGLKWVERDGHSLVRRWNINAFQMGSANSIPASASVSGDLVARKIIPLHEDDSERGARGDADLLIWTGEKIGMVTTNPQYMDHEEMVQEIEGDIEEKREKAEQERKEEEYSKIMRQALERQADERRWMSRFRLKTTSRGW